MWYYNIVSFDPRTEVTHNLYLEVPAHELNLRMDLACEYLDSINADECVEVKVIPVYVNER